MKRKFLFLALTVPLVFSSVAIQCQQLTVQLDSGKQVVLSRADVEALPHVKVIANRPSVWFRELRRSHAQECPGKGGCCLWRIDEGQAAHELFARGAADGYRAVISLPELDPSFTDKQTLLAFLRDGKPLGDKEGPYRIVIPDEKRMAR